VRKGSTSLDHKQAVALSGKIYRAFAAALENNPGSYEKWVTVLDDNDAARAGDYGRAKVMIGQSAKVRQARLMHSPMLRPRKQRKLLLWVKYPEC
jgi:hypothetical protein